MKSGSQDVERAVEIDVDDGSKAIGGHAQRRRDEIAGCSGEDDIDFAVMVVCFLKSSRNAVVIAHVGGHTQRIAASFPYLLCRKADFFFRSADHGDFGASFCEALGDTQVDATACTGDKRNFALQHIRSECLRHLCCPRCCLAG
jgi:hypothetical protein